MEMAVLPSPMKNIYYLEANDMKDLGEEYGDNPAKMKLGNETASKDAVNQYWSNPTLYI